MDNTKLVTAESSNAELIEAVHEWDTHHRVHPMMRKLADRLEAAEAELTRRDTVIDTIRRELHAREYIETEDFENDVQNILNAIQAALAAAPVSLEVGRTNPIVATRWSESLPNDGTFEYTSGGSSLGDDVYYLRRTPELRQQVGGWESISREVYEASKRNWASEWLDGETEGDTK